MHWTNMNYQQLEAVFHYSVALQKGSVEPPNGAVLTPFLDDLITSMRRMRSAMAGQQDRNSIEPVAEELFILMPSFVEHAMAFMPSVRRVM